MGLGMKNKKMKAINNLVIVNHILSLGLLVVFFLFPYYSGPAHLDESIQSHTLIEASDFLSLNPNRYFVWIILLILLSQLIFFPILVSKGQTWIRKYLVLVTACLTVLYYYYAILKLGVYSAYVVQSPAVLIGLVLLLGQCIYNYFSALSEIRGQGLFED